MGDLRGKKTRPRGGFLLPIAYCLLPLLPVPDSRFPIPDSRFPKIKKLSTLPH
ncbi:MAG: hypothetical protein F6K53_34790 [Moorea sp. SIO4A1]|nr:hypothetical protein [Moorena sp. SIO4A1]